MVLYPFYFISTPSEVMFMSDTISFHSEKVHNPRVRKPNPIFTPELIDEILLYADRNSAKRAAEHFSVQLNLSITTLRLYIGRWRKKRSKA